MQPLQPLLESIGFNHQESAVYLHLLTNGELPASKVSSSLRVPRSTVRGILDKLCGAGILAKIYKRNTQYYSCKSPKTLAQYVERQQETLRKNMETVQDALPLFQSIYAHPAIVPKVQVFEGPEQVIEAFNHSLFAEGIKEILFITSYRFLRDPVVKRNDLNFYIPKRVKMKLPMRVLVGKAEESDKPIVNDRTQYRERRQLTSTMSLPGNIHIYGNYVVYFSAGEKEYLAVLIESPMMAETMRALFNLMWEQCKPSPR